MYTTDGANLLLTWAFTTTAVTRPTAWWVALHTADPGLTGANEVLVATDADYVRKAITFADPAGKVSLNDAAVSWTVNSGSAGYTALYASIWTAETGGICLKHGLLLIPRVLVADGVLTFNIGEVASLLT